MDYATVNDLIIYWKNLTSDEQQIAAELIADASSKIRLRAKRLGINFDQSVSDDEDLAAMAKAVVCKCVSNAMKQKESLPFSQYAEAVGGYSISGTFANVGGGLTISRNDWKELGLSSQRYGGLDIYGTDKRDSDCPL